MQTFKTIREAAVAASKVAVPLTKQTGNEYGGLIYKADGGYAFTDPDTSDDTGHLDPTPAYRKFIPDFPTDLDDIHTPRVHKQLAQAGIVSSYHVHPCNEDTGYERLAPYFSRNDMYSMTAPGFKAIYMAVVCSGKVYEATKRLRPILTDGGVGALGKVIGTV